MKILDVILSLLKTGLSNILCSLFGAVKSVFTYLTKQQEIKIEEKEQKKEEEFIKKVDDVVDNGDIQDLLDLKK